MQRLVDEKKIVDGEINAVSLYKSGAISKAAAPVKILAQGELTAKLNVEANYLAQQQKKN